MKPKDILQLAIRLLGLVFLYHGLQAVPGSVAQIFGLFPHEYAPGIRVSGSFGGFVLAVAMVGWPLLVSYWLLRGAPLIMHIAHPELPMTSQPGVGGVSGQG